MDPRISRQVDERLEELYRRHLRVGEDEVTRYYGSGRGYYGPAQANSEEDFFGVGLVSVDGDVHGAGDFERPFALQSISKVFVYGMALDAQGPERVLERVGVEPSGDAFHSIEFDEPQ